MVVAGLVVSVRHNKTQRGRMGSLVLDDRSGRIEAVVFGRLYEEYRELLVSDAVLVVAGSLGYDEYRGGVTIRADRVLEFQHAREACASHVTLAVDALRMQRTGHASATDLVHELEALLKPYTGGSCAVRVACPPAHL